MILGHLTDLHLNGKPDRRARFMRGLAKARSFKVDHLVLTGDLTKVGKPEQFQELAACLAGWNSVTIVPGNHDEGPEFDRTACLARFRHGLVQVGGVRILPLDTRFHGRALAFKALGRVGEPQLRLVAQAIQDPSPLVIAQHHGPHSRGLVNLLHGLTDRTSLLKVVPDSVHILSGHDHVIQDIGNLHIAASVAHHPDPLRVYEVGVGSFRSIHCSSIPGGFLTIGRHARR